jgi:hypothetical protein
MRDYPATDHGIQNRVMPGSAPSSPGPYTQTKAVFRGPAQAMRRLVPYGSPGACQSTGIASGTSSGLHIDQRTSNLSRLRRFGDTDQLDLSIWPGNRNLFRI